MTKPSHQMIVFIFATLMAVVSQASLAQEKSGTLRGFTVEDFLSREELGSSGSVECCDISPDGRRIAFVKVRPLGTQRNFKFNIFLNTGGDVWLQERAGIAPHQLTDGASDQSTWWAPEWSPDGRRLAMLSTRGEAIGLWIYDGISHGIRRITQREVVLDLISSRTFAWLDNRRILTVVNKEVVISGAQSPARSLRTVEQRWQRFDRGEGSATVLESSGSALPRSRDDREIVVIDVDSGAMEVVTSPRASFRNVRASAAGDAIIYQVLAKTELPRADTKISQSPASVYSLEYRRLDRSTAQLPRIFGRNGDYVWAPDGATLAVLGSNTENLESRQLYRVSNSNGSVKVVDTTGLRLDPGAAVTFTRRGELMIRAAAEDSASRQDWWVLGEQGRRTRLTASMPDAPSQLFAVQDLDAYFGMAKGAIWRIDQVTGEVKNLTAKLKGQPVRSLLPGNVSRERGYPSMTLSMDEDGKTAHYVIDFLNATVAPLRCPSNDAVLVGYAAQPRSQTVLMYGHSRKGTFLWRTASGGEPEVVMTSDPFISSIQAAEMRPLNYTSTNGQPLIAWTLSAPNPSVEKRPMLVWLYPGTVYNETPPLSEQLWTPSPLNMQIPAAQGYTVLMPSMPLNEGPDDPLLRLTEGVLPAVDQAIASLPIDAQKIVVMGHSFGGYAAAGIVSQTNRFKAAVAISGLMDLVNEYSALPFRYSEDGGNSQNGYHLWWAESGQGHMGAPPWQDPQRYWRNSPISYVNNINTPLLLIHGDEDHVSMGQSEGMFRSLYRLGKRTELVRYWGENHLLRNPSNIRDAWTRIMRWFDENCDISRPSAQ